MTISRAYFAYSSQAMSGYAPWPDKLQDLVDLQPGLNFAAPMSLDIFSSAVTMLEELVDSHTPLKFSGSFSPDGSTPYPIAKLTFTAGSRSFHLTDQLSVENPAFVIEITEPVDLLQDISLSLTASTDDLDFSTEISGGDPTLTFSAVPKPGRQFTADKILTLPGGEHFREFVPDELIHAFAECALKSFSITLAAGKGISLLSLSVESAEGFKWSLVPDALILEDLALELNVLDPSGPDGFTLVSLSAGAVIFPSIFPDKFDFHLGLDQAAANKWEVSSITGSYFRNVNLHDLVAAIAGQASAVPDQLHAINFSDFDVEVTKQGDSHSYSLRTRCDAAFPILDTSVLSSLFLVADYSGTAHEIDLRGFVGIGDEDFSLELKLSDSVGAGIGASPLHLSWAANGTSALQLEDIAEALGFKGGDIPNLPPGFSLPLASADLTCDYVTKELEIETDGTLTIAGVHVPFKAARKNGLWTLEGKADSNQQIDFITLITELFREFGFDLPEHLPEFSLKNLQVDYNFETKDLTFAGDLSVPSPVQFGNATHQINSRLDLKIRTDATGKRTYAGYLRGTVAFGGAVFQGEFDFGAATVLKGYWDYPWRVELISAANETEGAHVRSISGEKLFAAADDNGRTVIRTNTKRER